MALKVNLIAYTSFLQLKNLQKKHVRATFKLYAFYLILILNFNVLYQGKVNLDMSYIVGQVVSIAGKYTGCYFTLYNSIQKVSFFKNLYIHHPYIYAIEEFLMKRVHAKHSRRYAKEFYSLLFDVHEE